MYRVVKCTVILFGCTHWFGNYQLEHTKQLLLDFFEKNSYDCLCKIISELGIVNLTEDRKKKDITRRSRHWNKPH